MEGGVEDDRIAGVVPGTAHVLDHGEVHGWSAPG
jgi:hypothetical protein